MNWISPKLLPPNGTPVYLRINNVFHEGWRRNGRWEDNNGNEIDPATVYGWGKHEN